MNLKTVFFICNVDSEKVDTVDNLYELATDVGHWKVIGAFCREGIEIYDYKFRPVSKEDFKEALLEEFCKVRKLPEFTWFNRGRRRHRHHYFRQIKTTQERKVRLTLSEEDQELRDMGYTLRVKTRKRNLPNTRDCIHHARTGDGWKCYRKQQRK
ncbi:hypothetical protein [Vibrio crassostreae]|uniref:hypothetical protein n=1 Tax=Vibrio crassostreae TaxID=246167 RepID=UPI001B314ED7|nr:hypothetical protein [Vibrio crassostreae]